MCDYIQACRGIELSPGLMVHEDSRLSDAKTKELRERCIPIEADFLYAYSTAPGLPQCSNTRNR